MSNIEVFNETNLEINELDIIKNLCSFLSIKETADNVEFNVIIVDNKTIKEINRDYRKIDRVTDVISFALEDYPDISLQDGRVLGDIYISIDKVKEQATEYGHSVLRELAFLTTHGFLHLLGYDHMNIDDEKIMFNKQKELLEEYGINR